LDPSAPFFRTRPSAWALLNDPVNTESPLACEATVVIIAGGVATTLEETGQSQYEAGFSDLVPDLPPLTLTPGGEHTLEVDLDSDGAVEITGEVTLGDISNFRTTSVSAAEVQFAWDDAGVVADTTYSVQVSDEADFLFPDNFASGQVTGATEIAFGGSSEWPYFTATGTVYARIQAEAEGTLSSGARFTAVTWPVEPILAY